MCNCCWYQGFSLGILFSVDSVPLFSSTIYLSPLEKLFFFSFSSKADFFPGVYNQLLSTALCYYVFLVTEYMFFNWLQIPFICLRRIITMDRC